MLNSFKIFLLSLMLKVTGRSAPLTLCHPLMLRIKKQAVH